MALGLDFWRRAKYFAAVQKYWQAAMSGIWYTKYGPRRVRFDPPTLKEAIVAAQGLTGNLDQQAEIAAALMEIPIEDVRAELAMMSSARHTAQIVTSSSRSGSARTVIVEKRPSRHFVARAGAPQPAPASRGSALRPGKILTETVPS